MSRTLQFKRYGTAALANTTGANGELIIDSTTKSVTVHDGSTSGGTRLATEEYVSTHNGGTFVTDVHITSVTPTNEKFVGSLVTDGGASINGNLFVDQTLYVGDAAFTSGLNYATIISTGSGNQYAQIGMKNLFNTGSADVAAYADNGSDNGAWIDMGITGSAFNDPTYTITKPNDGYIFVLPATSEFGGNLIIATSERGFHNDIVFASGGFRDHDEVARFHGNVMTSGTFNSDVRIVANAGITIISSAPTHSYGVAGDKRGMLAFDEAYIYYCTANYVNNSTHIWKRTAHGAGTW